MEILVSSFVKGILIALRVSGIIFTAPIFNMRAIPNRAKLLLTILITYIIFFMVPNVNPALNDNLMMLAVVGLKEMMIGIIIGFAMNFVFYGISFAGLLLGYDMGLMIAQMFDPTTDSQSNIVGQTLLIIGVLVFVVINGHHFVIQSIGYSFKLIPVGFYPVNEAVFKLLGKYSAGIFILAIKISSPILVSFFLVDVGAGIIARVIPQMNVFFVVQPLKIELGLVLIVFIIPVYVYVIRDILLNYEDKILVMIQNMGL